MQALLLRHRHQSGSTTANTEIVKAQRLLQKYGYYSGRVDGTLNQRTREALRSFQQSRQLAITGYNRQENGARTRTRVLSLSRLILL